MKAGPLKTVHLQGQSHEQYGRLVDVREVVVCRTTKRALCLHFVSKLASNSISISPPNQKHVCMVVSSSHKKRVVNLALVAKKSR